MKVTLLKKNKNDISDLINDVNMNHEPILLKSVSKNAVLVSEDDWRALEETNYLNSIPSMKEKLMKGKNTDIEDCCDEDKIEW